MARRQVATHAPEDVAEGGMGLLIIDMLSDWQFPDADKLLPAAAAIAPVIARLRARFRRAGLPVIYANDNHGRWRSDLQQLLADARAAGGPGAEIAERLAPGKDDYFVLKPVASAFVATPLELLLRHLGLRRLVITGVASDQCVLVTAAHARMRELEVVIPRDAVASQTPRRTQASLLHFEEVMKVSTPSTARVRLARR